MVTTATATRTLEILLVEDNPADAAMLRFGFEAAEIPCVMNVTGNGFEAISHLLRTGRFRDQPRPDLVVLDLNLPRRRGSDVLARIKSDPDLSSLPVVVLTGSERLKDIGEVYDNHASCYATKPGNLTDYATLARLLRGVWLHEAEPRVLP